MNKKDVIMKISEETGIDAEVCGNVIAAFEDQSGEGLLGKFKGLKMNDADMLDGISKKSGYPVEECEKVLSAFRKVLDTGLTDKLKFWKHE